MKYAWLAVVLMLSIPAAAAEGPQTLNLMPVPAQLEQGNTFIEIDSEFTVTIEGGGATARLREGVQRMLRRLSDRSTLFFDGTTFLQLEGRSLASMVVTAGREGELALGEDESYRLEISADGVDLTAATGIGALRGLETVLQLLTRDDKGIRLPAVVIDDAPRFPWRGLMIDSSRHFMPVGVLKRNLDGTLCFRKSCAHGVCGSDAMTINGVERLACKTLIRDVADQENAVVTIEPLKSLPVQRDLMVDYTRFFDAYRIVKPFLIPVHKTEQGETIQTPSERSKFDDATKCILCASCHSSCPVVENDPEFIGPAAVLQAARFVFDSMFWGRHEQT